MRHWMAVWIALAACGVAFAHERTWGLDALRGIDAVNVVVEKLPYDAEHDGVKRSALQADIELRLRRAGIGIATDRSIPEKATLRCRLDDMKRDLDQGAFHEFRLTLELMQAVQLQRDPGVQAVAAPWSRSMDGTQLTATLVASVRNALRQEMEHFIDDYLAANAGQIRAIPQASARQAWGKRPEGD